MSPKAHHTISPEPRTMPLILPISKTLRRSFCITNTAVTPAPCPAQSSVSLTFREMLTSPSQTASLGSQSHEDFPDSTSCRTINIANHDQTVHSHDLESPKTFSFLKEGCPEHPKGCPVYPRDTSDQHRLAIAISREGGKDRFPPRSHHYFVHDDIYKPIIQPVSPGTFNVKDLPAIHSAPPLYINLERHQIDEETHYRGIVYRFSAIFQTYEVPLRRGTHIVINSHNSDHVKYVVTIRRHLDRDFSLVQLNAMTISDEFLEFDNPHWPTALLSVRNQDCEVPMPRHIAHYFSDYIATPPTFWSRFKAGSQQSVSETRWNIELLD